MQLLLIRHAESQHNAKETDHLDSGITKLGRKQSIELSAFLKRKFEDIGEWKGFVSPFLRTLQTAHTVWEHTGVDFTVDWRLREYGHASSGYHAGVRLEIPVRRDKFPHFFKTSVPASWVMQNEHEIHLLTRMLDYLNFLREEKHDKVIIVSHAMPIYTMIYILKNTPMVPKWDRKILNTSVTWFEHDTLRYFARFVNSGNDPRGESTILPML